DFFFFYFFFFFQAEDGIRDRTVTGVQTCALPISDGLTAGNRKRGVVVGRVVERLFDENFPRRAREGGQHALISDAVPAQPCNKRSEERRVGKECRSRWSPHHAK